MIDEDGAFTGYEAGTYTVFAHLGQRTASATIKLANREVRRPAEVVGRLGRTLFSTEEVWLHPNGKNLYLGTGGGGDRMYAVDISDPATRRDRLAGSEHAARERHHDHARWQIPRASRGKARPTGRTAS